MNVYQPDVKLLIFTGSQAPSSDAYSKLAEG